MHASLAQTTRSVARFESQRRQCALTELNGIALAGFGNLYNSLRDDFLDDVGLPHVVKRLAGALEGLAHVRLRSGSKTPSWKNRRPSAIEAHSPVDSATAAGARRCCHCDRSIPCLRFIHGFDWNPTAFSGVELFTPRDLIRARRAPQRRKGWKRPCRKRSDIAGSKPRSARHARKKPPTRTRASFFSDSGIHGSKQRSDTSRRPRPLPTRARSGGRLRSRPSLARTTGVRARTTHARTRRRSGSERHDDIGSMPLSLSFEFPDRIF
jgi:hypothetical protein